MKTTLAERTHTELMKIRTEITKLRNESWGGGQQSAQIGDQLDKILSDHYDRIPHMISGE